MKAEDSGAWSKFQDTQLRSALTNLLAAGYRTEARIIAHLAEVEQRKLHLEEGSESLYDYCTRVLHLSNSEAFHRITAARVARQFPIVFSLIDQRQLHLTAVCLLRDYLTAENHRELLTEASHKTKWQVQELLARRFPRPDVESRVRKLPALRPAAAPIVPIAAKVAASEAKVAASEATIPPRAPSPSAREPVATEPAATEPVPKTPLLTIPAPIPVEPLSEARYRIQLNASAALKEKLDRLRALTSHSNPSGDIAVIIERALELGAREGRKATLRQDRPPARVAQALRPDEVEHSERAIRSAKACPCSEHSVARESRSETACSAPIAGENGQRCTARAFLQVHHECPWARGGEDTVENLRLLCAAHNRLLAERDFGTRTLIKARAAAEP